LKVPSLLRLSSPWKIFGDNGCVILISDSRGSLQPESREELQHMKKKFMVKIVLTCSLTVTGLFGFMIGSPSKASAATQQTLDLIAYGKEHLGKPYLYGAPTGITYAFDCSSYVQYVFSQFGVDLPRTSVSQAHVGQKVEKGYLSVGDLIFFSTLGGGISHVAIYAGDGMILHASSSRGITLANMETNYWQDAYVTARRLL
jgi:probable lipoprotein NlpC